MEIYFRCKKIQKACSSERESDRTWGDQLAKKVRQRLAELKAAETLAEISHLPPARCHELSGKRRRQFAVDLKHPLRLVFEPMHSRVPLKEDGGVDLGNVTAICIVGVEDYHGKGR